MTAKKVLVNSGVVRATSGFTLTEFLVVVAIFGVLATLLGPALEPMRARAEKVVCVGNIRSLYVSIGAYLADHKKWPQIPEDATEEQFDDFWLRTTESYGASEKSWRCPSIARMSKIESASDADRRQMSRLHYLPTSFDDNPMRPHRFPTHPWLMEIGAPHGRGNLIIQADGTVRDLHDILLDAGFIAK